MLIIKVIFLQLFWLVIVLYGASINSIFLIGISICLVVITVFVIILIHYQALKLFFKKNKYFSKPIKLSKDVTYDQIK